MKYFALAFLALLSTSAFAQKTPTGVIYDANILRTVDGDTVVVEAVWIPAPLKKEVSVRIFGVDTPEKGYRAKCPVENIKGKVASAFTKDLIAKASTKQYILYDWDKYGGRVLGDIILDGKSLREQLIVNGHARAYFGTAKQSWCK